MIEMTVLGARAGMPTADSPSSGYLVRAGDATLLLDCGPGVALALQRHAQPTELDAVLVSHMHTDHSYDLLPLARILTMQRLHPDADDDLPPVPLYVQAGGAKLLADLAALFPVSTNPRMNEVFTRTMRPTEYQPTQAIAVRDVRVQCAPTTHALTCSAFRVSHGQTSLTFTGDTGWSDVVDLARGTDLLLAECSRADPDPTAHGHLSPAQVGRMAAAAGAGAVLLTHLPTHHPDWVALAVKETRRQFAGHVDVARPGGTVRAG